MEPTAFFDFPSRGKAGFRRFLVFPRGGKPVFADFLFSLAGESWFSLICDFPSRGKADFRWFLIFPREGKLIFTDFWFSLVEDSWFSLIFVRRTPYEAWFFVFFAHRRGTKPYFMRFSSIVPLRKLHFSVFRWLYPVSEQIFPKIDNLLPYLSYFSWKLMIYSRTWADLLENNRPFLCLKTSFDYRFIFLSWHSFSYKKGKKE